MKYPGSYENGESGKCDYKMGNVVDSEGSAEWRSFLDEQKGFVPLISSPIPQNPCQKCEKGMEKRKSNGNKEKLEKYGRLARKCKQCNHWDRIR